MLLKLRVAENFIVKIVKIPYLKNLWTQLLHAGFCHFPPKYTNIWDMRNIVFHLFCRSVFISHHETCPKTFNMILWLPQSHKNNSKLSNSKRNCNLKNKNLCSTGLFNRLLIYIYFVFSSINNEWSFDDTISKVHRCELLAFDPS